MYTPLTISFASLLKCSAICSQSEPRENLSTRTKNAPGRVQQIKFRNNILRSMIAVMHNQTNRLDIFQVT